MPLLRASVILAAALLSPFALPAMTLEDVLRQSGIPLAGFDPAALSQPVSSGFAKQSDDGTVLVYPTSASDDQISLPLHVVVYRKGAERAAYRAIQPGETSDACFGAALRMSEQGGFFLVELHLNPSASCTIVLDSNLRVRHTLFAWPVAQTSPQEALLVEDQVHFAPVHPLRLATVDLSSGKTQELYPPDGDPLRAAFSRELKKHLPDEAWCREHNTACNPEVFEEQLAYTPLPGGSGATLALLVTYSSVSFGEAAGRDVGDRTVAYVYRRGPEGWTYCQEELADAEVQPRIAQLLKEFHAATRGCTDQKPVKVAPVDSVFSQFSSVGAALRP